MKSPQEFIDDLKEHFWNKKPFLLEYRQRDSVFDTIKAYLQKKNLVVVSKVEYDKLKNQSDFAYKDIDEFEKTVGYKVGPVFKDGWSMARTTNKQLGI